MKRLLLSDIETIEKRLLKTEKQFKSNQSKARKEHELLERLFEHFNNGFPAKTFPFLDTVKKIN